MIDTKAKLKECLKKEKNFYVTRKSWHDRVVEWIVRDPNVRIWNYQKVLRYTEYYFYQSGMRRLLYLWYRRRKNRLGLKLGFEVSEGVFDSGLIFYHTGNIVINGFARVGKDCRLHGDNCIGNDGITLDAPRIGNRVDIGVGAKVIGNIEIADDIVIGAGAIVTKSFLTPGVTLVGIPAHELRKEKISINEE